MIQARELVEQGERIFVIGDIHGCLRELSALLTHLVSVEKLTDDDHIIFIGDYIDRGPDSKGVIDTLINLRKDHPRTLFLKGNHEDMLAAFMGKPGRNADIFLENGGTTTLESYNISERTGAALLDKIPEEHLIFFANLESIILGKHFIFVHAGLDPLRTVEGQQEGDLFWIRDHFIRNIHQYGKTVLFGHTPFEDLYLNVPYKIGIDTGLVYGNKLSCIELKEAKVFQVDAGTEIVKIKKLGS